MTQPAQPRRFGPIDAILLAAALAAAIAISRIDPATLEDRLGLPPSLAGFGGAPPFWERLKAAGKTEPGMLRYLNYLKEYFKVVLAVGTPVLVLGAPGVALATFRGRSPRRRRLRGVGMLTTALGGALVVIYLANEYVLRRLSPTLKAYGNNPFVGIWGEIADEVSVAILALWVVLALGRRWHAEPHWRDRLGRAMGGAWIVYWILDSVLAPIWLYH